jgi:CheY-like chemotaxis protein
MATILIVEDDSMLQEMMVQALEMADHVVVTAGNGREALECARATPPDLILMDIGMPEMDGNEATRQLKADAATKAIPIIALTAHASQADRQTVLAAGADDYESKPVDFDRLFAKIDAFLLRRGS